MKKILTTACTAVLTSLYFFPFEFTFLPGVNTKMMLAVLGLLVLITSMLLRKEKLIDKDFIILSALAAVFSIIGWISITINHTPDKAYATYLISMWVWLGASYFIYRSIRAVHGQISIPIICNYLAIVCVSQCVLALLIDNIVPLKRFVDTYIEQGQDYLNNPLVRRMYGIGASLDVAGSRFSAVLIMIAFVCNGLFKTKNNNLTALYIAAFFIIAIVGNMIARTTTVGLALALGYICISNLVPLIRLNIKNKKMWGWIFAILLIAITTSTYLYNTDPDVRQKFRFAFEGFFSLAEEGEWDVSSNERLKTMYVFPETLKTWVIGDGYFSNPRDVDPHFIGKETGGYYMGTDVGYLRFIFYSGLLGLIAFSCVIIYAAKTCIRRFPEYRIMFLMLLMTNFIIWFKVSTDIFLVFAVFLMLSAEEEQEYEEQTRLGL